LESLASRIVFPYDERYSWYRSAERAAADLLAEIPIRLVFSTSPPISCHIAAGRIKRKFHLKWVADFRDPLCNNFGRTKFVPKLLDPWFERRFFGEADILIANTDAAAKDWRGRYPQFASRIHVIYNGFDPDQVPQPLPIPPRSYRTLLHAGSLYYNPYPLALFRAIEALRQRGRLDSSKLRVNFVGDIEDKSLLTTPSFLSLQAAGMLECLPRAVPAAEARRMACESDFLLALDRWQSSRNLQIPAKIFDYIPIGRPILAFTSHGTALEYVLSRSGVPHVCLYPEDSPEQLEKKLLAFLALPSDPVPPRAEFMESFSGRSQTAQLARLLDDLGKA
jgi:glycosyltransferase involved in cell wall biosynthesis